jgi:hypothetical protein
MRQEKHRMTRRSLRARILCAVGAISLTGFSCEVFLRAHPRDPSPAEVQHRNDCARLPLVGREATEGSMTAIRSAADSSTDACMAKRRGRFAI